MNFSFLSPIFLIGVLAVSLPIIAHLISRKSGFKKRFPAVRFLLASQGEMATRSRLKDLILLVLRALIIVLIALLFAKPALFSFSKQQSSEPSTLTLVVDNSFSMGYGENFDRAKKEALSLLDSAADGSFFAVLPLVTDKDGTISVIQDRGKVRRDIQDLTLSQTYTENERRLERIYSSLESAPNREKRVVLITDFQKNGWEDEDFDRSWLTLIDVSEEGSPVNRAVTHTDSIYTKDAVELKVRVSNYSDTPAKELLAEVKLSAQEVNSYLDIGPKDFATEKFVFPLNNQSADSGASGIVTIPDDKLRIDDARHFVLSRSGALNVLIVDGDAREDARSSESYYLASAAETASELLNSRIRIKDNEGFLDDELSSYDLIFLTNVGEITPTKANELKEYINLGGTAVIFPGDRVRAGSYNTLLKEILPGELGPAVEVNSDVRSKESKIFSEELFDKLGQARVEKAFTLIAYEDTEPVLTLSDGTPFLISKSYGGGNVFLFTSTADTAWGNFAITPVFAPVIKEFLDFESLSNSKRRNFIIGDEVTIDRASGASSIEVRTPSEESRTINTDDPVFRGTNLAGLYEVLIDGEKAYEFSVNVAPLESNLEKLTIPEIEAEPEAEPGLVKVFRELWRYFLWGVIALFISESVARAFFS